MFFSKIRKNVVLFSVVLMVLTLLHAPSCWCQYWIALPPYNTLWPLWSPALSPLDPTTGLPTPIVTSLAPNTILPVQPGLTWDPSMAFPWFLYNSPFNTLIYYDTVFGINPWPPTNYLAPAPNFIISSFAGAPIPISLPVNYSWLPPTDPAWIQDTLHLANEYYAAAYQYYVNNASSILPLFPLLPPGFTIPPLLPDLLETLLSLPITISIPPVLSATAIIGF